jgi:hypothetical protein
VICGLEWVGGARKTKGGVEAYFGFVAVFVNLLWSLIWFDFWVGLSFCDLVCVFLWKQKKKPRGFL